MVSHRIVKHIFLTEIDFFNFVINFFNKTY